MINLLIMMFLHWPQTEYLSDGTNLDCLSYAVASKETSNCTKGTGKSRNNCHGIRRNGKFEVYESPLASHRDFKGLWKRGYGSYPNMHMANKYSGGGGATWLPDVTYFYNECND